MCEFPRDRALKDKGPILVTQSLLDESANEPISKRLIKFMVRHRVRSASMGYHVFPVIEESESYYIVEDSPTLPDCIPMLRYGGKLLALPKRDWERVPRVVWRDVTKEVEDNRGGVLMHKGALIRLHDRNFEITIKRRVEVEG